MNTPSEVIGIATSANWAGLVITAPRTAARPTLDLSIIKSCRTVSKGLNCPCQYQAYTYLFPSAENDCDQIITHTNMFDATACVVSLTTAIQLCDKLLLFSPSQMYRRPVRWRLFYLLQCASFIAIDVPGTDTAITCDRRALELLPENHPERSVVLATLAMRVYTRFTHFKGESDLNDAIALAESAASGMAKSDHNYERAVACFSMMKMQKIRLSQDPGPQELQDFFANVTDWSRMVNPDEPILIEAYTPSIENNVVRCTIERWNKSRSLDDLSAAIKCIRKDLDSGSQSGLPAAVMSSQLGTLLRERFLLAGDRADLDEARYWSNKAVEPEPVNDIEYLYILCQAGRVFLTCYEEYNIESDLHRAIEITMKGKSLTKPGNPQRFTIYHSVMECMLARHQLSGNIEDLMTALSAGRVMTSGGSGDSSAHWHVAAICNNLYIARFDRADLERGLSHALKALQIASSDCPNRSKYLGTVAWFSLARYKLLKVREDLNRAAACWKKSLALVSSGGQRNQDHLEKLAEVLSTIHRDFKCGNSRDEGIAIAEEALPAMKKEDPKTVAMQVLLQDLLLGAYDENGRIKDLERSIKVSELLLAAQVSKSHGEAAALSTLGSSTFIYYEGTGDSEALERAIQFSEAGLDLFKLLERSGVVSATLDELAGLHSDVGIMIIARYDRYGDSKDLHQSLEYLRISVALCSTDHPKRSTIVGNLAGLYYSKYHLSQALEYLEDAIRYSREAIKITKFNEVHHQRTLVNHSEFLTVRYHRLLNLVDLEEATIVIQEAAKLETVPSSKGLHALLVRGRVMLDRYHTFNERLDLDTAIDCFIKGNESVHAGSDAISRNLILLSTSLCVRYTRYRELKDLHDAIVFGESGLAKMPRNHPNRAAILIAILKAVRLRYEVTSEHQDFHYILQAGYEAWLSPLAPTEERIYAGRVVSIVLSTKHMWEQGSQILQAVVRMLPSLSRRSMARVDQESSLSGFSNLSGITVSFQLFSGDEPASCVRILEFGRGIIMGLLIDCRDDSDLIELRLNYPRYFEKFDTLRQIIDQPVVKDEIDTFDRYSSKGIQCEFELANGRREDAVYAMDGLLVEIRMLSTFERFRLPPYSSELMRIALEGPILIFNSTKYRTDAIIVTSDQIQSIRLSNMDYTTTKNWMEELPKLVNSRPQRTYPQRNARFQELLLWLWENAVEPVFELLGLNAGSETLPRVWWIGTGPLTKAPFHAAGDHLKGSTRNCITRVISSYIPTIKALKYARNQEIRLPTSEESQILLVSMSTTPGEPAVSPTVPRKPHSALKSVLKEVEEITKIVQGRAKTKHLHSPSKADVLKELPTSSIAHFACHGVSNGHSPSESCLLLRKEDGTEEGVLDKLTVGDISITHLPTAHIAYLSACSTAQNSSEDLMEESIYIASAFQLAGFSHVLATQWVASDMACQQVAKEFYQDLFSRSEGGHEIVSRAFHHAVMKLREGRVNQPIMWGCFIHTGA